MSQNKTSIRKWLPAFYILIALGVVMWVIHGWQTGAVIIAACLGPIAWAYFGNDKSSKVSHGDDPTGPPSGN